MPTVFQQMNEMRRGDVAGPDATAAGMANQIKQELTEADEAATELPKFGDTCAGRLAGNKWFEVATISVICLNALWLGYDAEYTATIGKPDDLYEGPVHIIVVEQMFAVFFTFEIVLRFIGARVKALLIFDGWFMFDSILVSLMVLEIWLLPLAGGGLPGFGILRLLRLLRITRMAKLMRAVPEIMTIVSGLATSVKAVSSVALLLLLITYIFAIVFTGQYHQGNVPDGEEGDIEVNFGSMGKSFFSLIIMGAIFDDLTYCTDSIRQTGSTTMLVVFVCYMLLSGFVMLNMLVGILAEVVNASSDGDKAERMVDDLTNVITQLAEEVDQDGDALISSSEFRNMQKTEKVAKMLKAVNITAEDFEKLGEFAFAHADAEAADELAEPTMTYGDLVDLICRIRPDVKFGALQFSTFECAMTRMLRVTSEGLHALDELSARAAASAPHSPPANATDSAAVQNGEPLPLPQQGPQDPDMPTTIFDERWAQISSGGIIEELRRRACDPPTAPPVTSEPESKAEALPSSARLPFAAACPPAPKLPFASPRPEEDRIAAAARPPRPPQPLARPGLLAPIPGLDRRLSAEELEKSGAQSRPPVLPAEGTAVSSVVQRPSSASRSRRPSSAPRPQASETAASAPGPIPGAAPGRPATPPGAPPAIDVQQESAPQEAVVSPPLPDATPAQSPLLREAAPAQEGVPEGAPGSAELPFAPFGVPDSDDVN